MKDLDYYLKNPDEMPTDPKEIEALANEHMAKALESGGEEQTIERFEDKDDKKDASSGADQVKEEPVKTTVEPTGEIVPEEKTPDGILAKDGKNVIPYSQLESARQRATSAETLLAEQQAEIVRLKAEAAAGKSLSDPNVDTLSEEELNALAEDSPTLAKILRSQQNVIRKLNETVDQLSDQSQQQQAAAVENVQSEVQTAIDANQTLAAWQTDEDQTMWDRAAVIDATLRSLPEYKEVSFEKRFETVVKMTQFALGIEEQQPIQDEPKPTQEEIKSAAKAKLVQKSKTSVPRSLSDIPGGAPPAVDEKQKVEQMSSVALGQQFLTMSKDQLDAYLSSL